MHFTTLGSKQNRRNFANKNFKCIYLREMFHILIEISLLIFNISDRYKCRLCPPQRLAHINNHNAAVPYSIMHHFVKEICRYVHISVTKWCIVEYLFAALWDLWDGLLWAISTRTGLHYNEVTLVSRRLRSSATRVLFKQRFRITARKTSKTLLIVHLWGESTGDQWPSPSQRVINTKNVAMSWRRQV